MAAACAQVSVGSNSSSSTGDTLATHHHHNHGHHAITQSRPHRPTPAGGGGAFKRPAPRSIDAYERVAKLGEGTFGIAWLCRVEGSDTLHVLKAVSADKPSAARRAWDEARIHSRLRHPHIIGYGDVLQHPTDPVVILVLEHAPGGDLEQAASRRRAARQPFREDEILACFGQMTQALEYMHGRSLIHRDIKLSNFFLMLDGTVKLGDFGLSKCLAEPATAPGAGATAPELRRGQRGLQRAGSTSTDGQAQGSAGGRGQRLAERTCVTPCGTPIFCSPEQTRGGPYGLASDLWSFGCCLFQLCTLRPPFDADTFANLRTKILEARHDKRLPRTYSSELRTLVHELMSVEPRWRPSARELLTRPFIRRYLGVRATSVLAPTAQPARRRRDHAHRVLPAISRGAPGAVSYDEEWASSAEASPVPAHSGDPGDARPACTPSSGAANGAALQAPRPSPGQDALEAAAGQDTRRRRHPPEDPNPVAPRLPLPIRTGAQRLSPKQPRRTSSSHLVPSDVRGDGRRHVSPRVSPRASPRQLQRAAGRRRSSQGLGGGLDVAASRRRQPASPFLPPLASRKPF